MYHRPFNFVYDYKENKETILTSMQVPPKTLKPIKQLRDVKMEDHLVHRPRAFPSPLQTPLPEDYGTVSAVKTTATATTADITSPPSKRYINDDIYSLSDAQSDATVYADAIDKAGILDDQLLGVGGGALSIPSIKATRVDTRLLNARRSICVVVTYKDVCHSFKAEKDFKNGSLQITPFYGYIPGHDCTAKEQTMRNFLKNGKHYSNTNQSEFDDENDDDDDELAELLKSSPLPDYA